VIGCVFAITVVSTALNLVILNLYGEFDRESLPEIFLLAQAANLLGGAISVTLVRGRVRQVLNWLRDGTPREDAPAVLKAVIELPRVLAPRAGALILVLEIPVVIYAFSRAGADVSPAIAYAGTLEAVLAVTLFGFLVGELLLRPVARHAQETNSRAGLTAPTGSVALKSKLLFGLPIVNVMTAYVAVALSSSVSDPAQRLSVGVAAALLVSLTVSLVLTATLTRSLSAPVGELVDATGQVAHGNLSAFVHPLAGDELGVLAGRFNEMLLGLQERESLREVNMNLVDELRASRSRIVAAADSERQAVERDLHDGAQQYLVMLDLKLGIARKASEDAEMSARIDEARADLATALSELRDLAHGIYPQVLDSEGLGGALADAARRSPIPATVKCGSARRYPAELEAAVYFCCREALQNAGKHAGDGARAILSLGEHDGVLEFEVADDGRGFDPATMNGSAGLQNMSDRIGALGGELIVTSMPGSGTTIRGRIAVRR
jgi:signal transduction histidine kinase